LPIGPTGRSPVWQSWQEIGVAAFAWKTPFVVLAVKVPLATVSVVQFIQFVAAAALAWQLLQSPKPVKEWFIWFFTVV
jgi:hypothetical protein